MKIQGYENVFTRLLNSFDFCSNTFRREGGATDPHPPLLLFHVHTLPFFLRDNHN